MSADETVWHEITGEQPAVVDEPAQPERRQSEDAWRPPERSRSERRNYTGRHRKLPPVTIAEHRASIMLDRLTDD